MNLFNKIFIICLNAIICQYTFLRSPLPIDGHHVIKLGSLIDFKGVELYAIFARRWFILDCLHWWKLVNVDFKQYLNLPYGFFI